MIDWFRQNLEQSLGLTSPFCPLYLLASGGIAVLWLRRSQQWTMPEVLRYLMRQGRQHQRAIRTDAGWALFQVLLLRAPIAIVHLALFRWAYEQTGTLAWEDLVGWSWPQPWEACLVTIVTMLAIDAAAYAMHRALHELPGLWWIHRLHHEASFLTPFSTLRQHPLEPLLLNGARGLAAGLALGLLHLMLPNQTPVWTLAGMGPGFLLYMFTVNLHHAPLPIRYPRWLRWFLISPHIHHLHHSKAPEHHNKNYGVIFSFWDLGLGSYYDRDVGLGELEFGVDA